MASKPENILSMTNFETELSSLLNRYSKENESNTPDFILAEYLIGCLSTFNEALAKRDKWHKNNIILDGDK